ncbi:hypothetical protein [Escherichia phage AV123]|nr:hypothetical protein [Escherichia phage AV123]
MGIPEQLLFIVGLVGLLAAGAKAASHTHHIMLRFLFLLPSILVLLVILIDNIFHN